MVFIRSVLAVSALVATVAAAPLPQYGYGSSSSGYDNSNSGYDNSNNNNNYGNNNNNNYGNNNNNNYGNNNNNYGNNNNNNYGNSNNNYGNNNNYNTQTQDSTSTSVYNNNGYSSSSSSYNNNNNYNTQYNNNNNYNTQTQDSTSTYNNNNNNNGYYSSSSQYYNTQTQDSTSTYISTSTSTSFQTYSTPSYGSGNSNWGGSDYNNCVQQCLASYSAPPALYSPSATTGSGNGQTGGVAGTNGVTHTVIVAPTQGVLRYVPFAVNASVGDTIQFHWGANNHTVTKSSELLMCNKTSDSPFASGEQNQGYTFNQVVNDTNPTFYYCGTPTHCEKGMFGIINPPSAFDTQYSMNNVMVDLVQNSSTVAAAMTFTNNATASDSRAATWGNNIDLASLPAWAHEAIAENTLYTRAFLAANPSVYNADGSIDLSGSSAFNVPTDVAGAITAATNAAANTTSSSSSSAAPSASATGHNAARGLSAPTMLVAAVSVAITFFAL